MDKIINLELIFENILKETKSSSKIIKNAYHGSMIKNDNFNTGKRKNSWGHNNQIGCWFSSNKNNASTYGPYLFKADLFLKNPMIFDFEGYQSCFYDEDPGCTGINAIIPSRINEPLE